MREGFGRVVGEAMAMGKPVICSDVGGIPELVSTCETGILVPPGNADAIATQVLHLVADPEKASGLGKAARSRILKDFSLDRHVKLIEDAYAGILGN
jgi:glycosyltransferase involved in cell wall biosynthesis